VNVCEVRRWKPDHACEASGRLERRGVREEHDGRLRYGGRERIDVATLVVCVCMSKGRGTVVWFYGSGFRVLVDTHLVERRSTQGLPQRVCLAAILLYCYIHGGGAARNLKCATALAPGHAPGGLTLTQAV
jgi:hypothetical protein